MMEDVPDMVYEYLRDEHGIQREDIEEVKKSSKTYFRFKNQQKKPSTVK